MVFLFLGSQKAHKNLVNSVKLNKQGAKKLSVSSPKTETHFYTFVGSKILQIVQQHGAKI